MTLRSQITCENNLSKNLLFKGRTTSLSLHPTVKDPKRWQNPEPQTPPLLLYCKCNNNNMAHFGNDFFICLAYRPYRYFMHANFCYCYSVVAAWQIDSSYKSTHFFDSNDAIDKRRPPARRGGIGPKQKNHPRRVYIKKAERWIEVGQRSIERQPSERDRNGRFGSLVATPPLFNVSNQRHSTTIDYKFYRNGFFFLDARNL